MVTRSAGLLGKLIASGGFSSEQLAAELDVSAAEVESYASGRSPMSLSQQKCLALFVIRSSPRFASQGHALQAQVAAATTFGVRSTKSHAGAHVGWSSLRRK